jgi:hypothetical protein
VELTRSTRCSLKFATAAKREVVLNILSEYGRVVNWFIQSFWASCPSTGKLLKPVVDGPIDGLDGGTWLNYSMRQTAARDAIARVASKTRWKDRAAIPVHKGHMMRVSNGNVKVTEDDAGSSFDLWMRVSAGTVDGHKMTVRHSPSQDQAPKEARKARKAERQLFHQCGRGVLFRTPRIVADPSERSNILGVDTGIKVLASLSTGVQLGRRLQILIELVKRARRGSKAEGRARRRLKQYIDVVAKNVAAMNYDVVVGEDLTGISHSTRLKGRLSRNMRSATFRINSLS